MNPDPRERLPREIFEELMEEGAEAFRNVLEKLLNLAMELERSEFLGAEPYDEGEPLAERTAVSQPLCFLRRPPIPLSDDDLSDVQRRVLSMFMDTINTIEKIEENAGVLL